MRLAATTTPAELTGALAQLWREAAGLDLDTASTLLGIRPSTLGNWERGVRDLTVSDTHRLALAYGRPWSDALVELAELTDALAGAGLAYVYTAPTLSRVALRRAVADARRPLARRRTA